MEEALGALLRLLARGVSVDRYRKTDLDSVQEKNFVKSPSMEWLLQTALSFLSLDVISNIGQQTNLSSVLQKGCKHHIATARPLKFHHNLTVYYSVILLSKKSLKPVLARKYC